MRRLEENACAVACIRFAAASAAMIEIHEDTKALLNDLVRLAPLHVHEKTHPAGVMLISGIVQPLLRRQTSERAVDGRAGCSAGVRCALLLGFISDHFGRLMLVTVL